MDKGEFENFLNNLAQELKAEYSINEDKEGLLINFSFQKTIPITNQKTEVLLIYNFSFSIRPSLAEGIAIESVKYTILASNYNSKTFPIFSSDSFYAVPKPLLQDDIKKYIDEALTKQINEEAIAKKYYEFLVKEAEQRISEQSDNLINYQRLREIVGEFKYGFGDYKRLYYLYQYLFDYTDFFDIVEKLKKEIKKAEVMIKL